jgi:hypothetical protein
MSQLTCMRPPIFYFEESILPTSQEKKAKKKKKKSFSLMFHVLNMIFRPMHLNNQENDQIHKHETVF